jgi:hypothetical protein
MCGPTNRAAMIRHRFSNTGVKAGTANLRQVLRMPDASATSEIRPIYGNITRVMNTAAV